MKKKFLIIIAVIILSAGTGFYIIGSRQQKQENPKTEILYPEPAIHPEVIDKTFSENEAIDPIIDKQKHKIFYEQVKEKTYFSPVYMPQFLPDGYKLYSTNIVAAISENDVGTFDTVYKNVTGDELFFGAGTGDSFSLGVKWEKIRINIEGGRWGNFLNYNGNNYLLFGYATTGYTYYLKSKILQKQDLINIANSLIEVQ